MTDHHQTSLRLPCAHRSPACPHDPPLQDVDEALKRLPQDVLDARNQRLKRAHDLNMKHSELPAELKPLQTPYDFYLKDTLEVGCGAVQKRLGRLRLDAHGAGCRGWRRQSTSLTTPGLCSR